MTETGVGANVLGLATGLAFGALLQRGGLSDSATIKNQFSGTDWRVAGTVGTAVAMGGVAFEQLRRRGVVAPDVKPVKLGGILSGAALFGTGMTLGGYCPGTAVAGVGAGHRDAGWALLGMSAGALGLVRAYPALKKGLDAGDFGRVRLGAA
ncbi:MAG: YeeE/YedE family protein [Actinobacteria bacterium]|nr:YeeE/YedE family protein [Actinomycetota bacterium]